MQAALLFNIGAILAQDGANCDKSTDGGIRGAAKRFQVRGRSLLDFEGSIIIASSLTNPQDTNSLQEPPWNLLEGIAW